MSDDLSEPDSLFDETFEAAADVSEEIVDDVIEDPIDDEVGMTSEELDDGDEGVEGTKKKLLSGFTIFDAMLGMAFLFITLATLVLFLELNTFGKFPGSFPWRTSEFLNILW